MRDLYSTQDLGHKIWITLSHTQEVAVFLRKGFITDLAQKQQVWDMISPAAVSDSGFQALQRLTPQPYLLMQLQEN
jgi:hypothetical protein